MIEYALVETAAEFWEKAGGYSPEFEEAVLFNLPITLERLEKLTIEQVKNWLTRRKLVQSELISLKDRPLQACLITLGGQANFIFLDSTDSPAEQLFSLAHEVAHFYLDYQQPRQKVARKLGKSALEVLDGLRPATPEERLSGILAGVRVGPYHHFMQRDGQGNILSGQVLVAEERADRLAIELLAPYETVMPLVKKAIQVERTHAGRITVAGNILTTEFGLANPIAKIYAGQLIQELGQGQSFREWLGG